MSMKFQLKSNKEEMIEKDKRFSKSNNRSRKNYAIESAILQKKIVLDNSLNNTKQTIYDFTDLKSCCNRQLANIGSIVEESTDQRRHVMLLLTKLMLRFKYHISTGCSASNNYHGGDRELLAGAGQGNKFSGEQRYFISNS